MFDVKNCSCSNVKEEKKMGNVRGLTKEQYEERRRQAAKARHEFHVDRFKTISDSVAALFNNSSKFPVIVDVDGVAEQCTVFDNGSKLPVAFAIDGIDVDGAIFDVFLSECEKRGVSLGKQDIEWCVEMCYYPSWDARLINSEFVGEKIRVCKVKDTVVVNVADWDIETDGNFASVTFIESLDSFLCKIAQAYVDLADDMWCYAPLRCIVIDGKVHIFG